MQYLVLMKHKIFFLMYIVFPIASLTLLNNAGTKIRLCRSVPSCKTPSKYACILVSFRPTNSDELKDTKKLQVKKCRFNLRQNKLSPKRWVIWVWISGAPLPNEFCFAPDASYVKDLSFSFLQEDVSFYRVEKLKNWIFGWITLCAVFFVER